MTPDTKRRPVPAEQDALESDKARRSAKAKRKAELGPVGITALPLERRKFQPQPTRFVIGAAFDAEEVRGGPSDLVVVAVEPGRAQEARAMIEEALE